MTRSLRRDEPAVGYVLSSYPVLSQTFVVNEIAELQRLGRRVVVVALDDGDGTAQEAVDLLVVRNRPGPRSLPQRAAVALRRRSILLRHPGQIRRSLALRSAFDDSNYDPWVVPAIAAHFRARSVGWVHTHFAWGGAAHAMAVAELLGVPTSMTVHAKDIFVPKRDLAAKLARTDQLVSVCDYNDAWMDEHGMARPPTTRVVCGVRTVPVREVPTERDIIVVGRLVPKKGVDLLLRALPQLLVATPSLRVTVIGEGEQRGFLEELSSQLGVEHAVTFTGALPHAQTLDMISRSRLLVLPTRIAEDGDRDSMPVVVKEAMMRRIPIVGTDVVAMSEMVDESVGLLVPSEDVDALASAIAELLQDEGRRMRLGRAARERAIARFSLEQNVARLDAIWADTLARSGARSSTRGTLHHEGEAG